AVDQIVALAREQGCDAIHPGYGFLSESAELARACAAAGLTFIGPDARVLELFGDKAQARQLAQPEGVPVVQGTEQATTLEQAQAFVMALPEATAVLRKALAGGGGRGVRVATDPTRLPEAFERCSRAARAAFGNGGL